LHGGGGGHAENNDNDNVHSDEREEMEVSSWQFEIVKCQKIHSRMYIEKIAF